MYATSDIGKLSGIEAFLNPAPPVEVVAPQQQASLFDDAIIAIQNRIDIPDIVPGEYHAIWMGLSVESKRFALDSCENDVKQMVDFLALHVPTEQVVEPAKKSQKDLATVHKKQLRLFSPFPTDLTRISPFFPMATKDMRNRKYIKKMVIASHAWGTLVYSGPQLSVYEEDLLLYLLAAINESNEKFTDEIEGKRTYTYRGSLQNILQAKNVKRRLSASDYEEALASFKLMAGAVIDMTTSTIIDGKKTPKKTDFNNLIVGGTYDHETGHFVCTINPYFFNSQELGQVTWLDVAMRGKIKSPTAKALYRFVQSHRDDRWQGPYLTLSASLNLDIDQPAFKIRQRINNAIKELVSLKVLNGGSTVAGNTVILSRIPQPHPKKKIAAIAV